MDNICKELVKKALSIAFDCEPGAPWADSKLKKDITASEKQQSIELFSKAIKINPKIQWLYKKVYQLNQHNDKIVTDVDEWEIVAKKALDLAFDYTDDFYSCRLRDNLTDHMKDKAICLLCDSIKINPKVPWVYLKLLELADSDCDKEYLTNKYQSLDGPVLELDNLNFYLSNKNKFFNLNKFKLKIKNSSLIFQSPDLPHQEPIITEQHYTQSQSKVQSEECCYFGFPWARLIDKINIKTNFEFKNISFINFLNKDFLQDIKKQIEKQKKKKVYTICQNADWRNLIEIWKTIGITDVCLSHFEKNIEPVEGVAFHSWPLFASNYETPSRSTGLVVKNTKDKRYLASFVGSYQDNHRSDIRLRLKEVVHEKIYYELQKEWFYNYLVYPKKDENIFDDKLIETIRYNQILSDSIFSLCPEGYGPNTIRIWESMSIGSIPVIFSDNWMPPEIHGVEWHEFAIFIPTTEYEKTLDILLSIDEVKIESMRIKCLEAYKKFSEMLCFGDPIQDFLNEKYASHEDCLRFYKEKIASTLMYQDPKIIKLVTKKLKNNIKIYAKKNSTVYKQYGDDKVYTRIDFLNKDNWISKELDPSRIKALSTSGSTTGDPFKYYMDSLYFDFVQENSEFDIIRKEYGLNNKHINLLNLLKYPYNPKFDEFFLEKTNYSRHNKFNSFGSENFTTYFINFEKYSDDPDWWHEQLLDFLKNQCFDIIVSAGHIINVLNKYIKKNNFKNKITYLLSNTTQALIKDDFEFLKINGNIVHYCDHMRCWDGGASFFTCKYGTYHLNDNFSWTTQGADNKLISTDYFNIAAPFLNYWNGDLCEIKEDHELCECGRYYRPFKMLQNRPFTLKGPTKLTEIKKQIGELEFKNKITQVQFDNLSVNIYCNQKLSEFESLTLNKILQEYKVRIHE